MQTIETMRKRRVALNNTLHWLTYRATREVNERYARRCMKARLWVRREIGRYSRLIATAAIAEGRLRGYRERTLAEATSDRAAAIERRNKREDHNPRRSPGETY